MQRSAGVQNPPVPTGILEPARPVRRRSMAPHHRRRRTVALLSLIALVVLGVLLLSGGSGSVAHRPAALPQHGFFARIRALAGSGPGSLAARESAAENAAINRTLAYTPFVRIAGTESLKRFHSFP